VLINTFIGEKTALLTALEKIQGIAGNKWLGRKPGEHIMR